MNQTQTKMKEAITSYMEAKQYAHLLEEHSKLYPGLSLIERKKVCKPQRYVWDEAGNKHIFVEMTKFTDAL